MPLYYEVAKNYNSIESGIAIFPFTFTTAPAAIVVGFIITKTGKYRPSIVCSSSLHCPKVLTLIMTNFRNYLNSG